MEAAFWTSLGIVLYVYAGYPLVLAVWARLAPRPHHVSDDLCPAVSVVIAARDEAHRLPGRIDNLLALDYPADRLDVVVVSDGSTDRPARALAAYTGHGRGPGRIVVPRVRLIERAADGKAASLNAGVAAASHDILVFTDARQRFARDAVRRLVANFADPTVGVVSGELVLDCESDATVSSVGEGVGAYWRYEKWLRARESDVDSSVGATGAIYAMRRVCWRDLPPGTILDDVLAPMRAVLAGWRVVFDERARAFDTTAVDAAAESRRKRRTLAGNYQLVALEPRLVVPIVNRVWLQYVSHKLGRLAVPWAMMVLLVSNITLAFSSRLYLVAALAQGLFYGLALYGARLERRAADARLRGPQASEPERKAVGA